MIFAIMTVIMVTAFDSEGYVGDHEDYIEVTRTLVDNTNSHARLALYPVTLTMDAVMAPAKFMTNNFDQTGRAQAISRAYKEKGYREYNDK